jgi:hypothetical protein
VDAECPPQLPECADEPKKTACEMSVNLAFSP